MNLTRADTKKLKQAAAAAAKKLEEAAELLETFLPILPDTERATIARVRSDFPKAARALAIEIGAHPEIVAATEYDPEAVVEDLDNIDALEPLTAPTARIQQMLDDARLAWNAEAYIPSLELYGVAKVGAKKNGKLAQAIAPLAEVFATPRRKGKLP